MDLQDLTELLNSQQYKADMNFFTKHFTTSQMLQMSCSIFKSNLFVDHDDPVIILEFLKLNTKKVCDPMFVIGALLTRQDWEEGLVLVQDKIKSFIIENKKIPEDYTIDMSQVEKRKELFAILSKDPQFVRTDLRLFIIKIVEEL